jgi:TonB family protein
MTRGKRTCKILKEIRQQIAENNEIEYVTSECHFQGECKGTCPKCESEVRYLENELNKRRQLGKVVTIAGISLGVAGSFSACNSAKQNELPVLKNDTLTEMSVHSDTVKLDTLSTLPKETIGTVVEIIGDVKPSIDILDEDYYTETGELIELPIFVIERERPIFCESEPYMTGRITDEVFLDDSDIKIIHNFLENNLIYPKKAKKKGIEGNVIVSFVLNPDGSLSKLELVQDIGYGCGEEALRVLKLMPKLQNVQDKKKNVSTQMQLPINFTLDK